MKVSDYQAIADIPSSPGVYFWKRGDEILYIGKATNLKNRTASYLQKKLMQTRGPLIVKMVEEADGLSWRETDSALEALLLESYLIKKYQPSYNSKEKDNTSHNYLVITNESLPRVYPVRGRALGKLESEGLVKRSFGPFPQGKLLYEALKIIRKIFPFFGRIKKNPSLDEFYRQLGQLPSVESRGQREAYLKNISYIIDLFSGKKAHILKNLRVEMKKAAKDLRFEEAARLRNQLSALEHIKDIALLKHDFETSYYEHLFRIEAYDIAHLQGQAMLGTMVVHNGVDFEPEEYRVFGIRGIDAADDTGALKQVLSRRLSHPHWTYPNLIVVDGGLAQKRALESVLRTHHLAIPVLAVVKDARHKPVHILGQKKLVAKYEKQVLAINAESHRFSISNHRIKLRSDFLK